MSDIGLYGAGWPGRGGSISRYPSPGSRPYPSIIAVVVGRKEDPQGCGPSGGWLQLLLHGCIGLLQQ